MSEKLTDEERLFLSEVVGRSEAAIASVDPELIAALRESEERRLQAEVVLHCAPDLADNVMSGALSLDTAYAEVVARYPGRLPRWPWSWEQMPVPEDVKLQRAMAARQKESARQKKAARQKEAARRKIAAQSDEKNLADLQTVRPDLAELVSAKRLSLSEALFIAHR